MSKLAICQVADQGPFESLAMMLKEAGYELAFPDGALSRKLRSIGCDLILEVDDLVRGMGYERPFVTTTVGSQAMSGADLFVDVKAHKDYGRLVAEWPNLDGKILYYRINGCQPEITQKGGDEINLPCPILTPNLWYKQEGPWSDKAYAMWPPFYRWGDYLDRHGRVGGGYSSPICLIHNIVGWGYGNLIDGVRSLGVRCYGAGSPDGLVRHEDIPEILSSAICMVHLKSSDAPGYALYEAVAANCPLVVSRRLIWRCQMQELFIPGETCYVFDRETHDGLSSEDVLHFTVEIKEALSRLEDPAENSRIATNARARLQELMWRADRDGQGFKDFMNRAFQ